MAGYRQEVFNFSKAIRFSPNMVEAYNNRGLTYEKLQQYNEALRDYHHAINLGFIDAYTNRTELYKTLGAYKKALNDYTNAIAIQPDDPKLYIARGIFYTELQEYKKALIDYKKR